ncbi:hypothetical protein K435DRAFT_58024 [Dendrothele bispora CBS 962.96]|uniref:Uncharacterized protein n=1 Tax=Dendrothele bispora (strain CBS 962.96) TaxID=1314807 RepID=A0A4V4HG67_DENBC|nr:hypothetical protein K435DRAFT_58024 [Dendrothele bispora CBS 962.96]
MWRTSRSPARTDTNTHTYSDDSYEDSDSIDEIEATLTNVDDQLDDTEQALSTWSAGSSNPRQPTISTGYGYTGSGSYSGTYTGSYTGSGSYTSSTATPGGYTGSPSFTSLPTLLSPTSPTASGTMTQSTSYPPPSNDPRVRLSRITERTEGTSSRPVSGVSQGTTTVPARPRSAFLPTTPGRGGGHARSSTDHDRDLPPPGRANQLIGLFEATTTTSATHSRPGSPTKSSFSSGSGSGSSASYTRSQTPTTGYSILSPPVRPSTATDTTTGYGGGSFTPSYTASYTGSYTPTYTPTTMTGTALGGGDPSSTLSPSQFTSTQQTTTTQTQTQTASTSSTLRRPGQSSSPRSPLASVRNIVALWKERTPTKGGEGQGEGGKREGKPSPSVSPTPGDRRQKPLPPTADDLARELAEEREGLFGLRRRASAGAAAAAGRLSEGGGGGNGERASVGSGNGNGNGLDASELTNFLGGNGSETVSWFLLRT